MAGEAQNTTAAKAIGAVITGVAGLIAMFLGREILSPEAIASITGVATLLVVYLVPNKAK